MTGTLAGLLFDGVAQGGLLFIVSLGMAVTMGLMNFVNLAHGAFAMVGGYACYTLVARAGVPFLASLPLVFMISAAAGWIMERLFYRRLYGAGHLDQVLFTVGLAFVAMAGATYFWGPAQKSVELPDYLYGAFTVGGVDFGKYKLFVLAIVAAATLLLALVVERTRFGAHLRASVDNAQAASGVGIHVGFVFSATFAVGTGLAGLGGALGMEMLTLEPTYAVKYLVYFLLVSCVGGAGSLKGALVVALVLGVCDVMGSYFVPQAGAFVIYAVMVALLVMFPAGLFGRRA